jgi:serine/threonine protein kinase
LYDDWQEHAGLYNNPDFKTLYHLYSDFILEFKIFLKSSFSQIFIEFLLSCLEFDVNVRPDCDNIMESAFYIKCLKTFDDDQAMVVQVLNETFGAQGNVEKTISSKKEEKKRRSIKDRTYHDVICDICDADPIRGVRYKCLECENYDLCQECLDKDGHKQHVILRLVKSTVNLFPLF